MPNLVVGPPVTGSDFYGREELVVRLKERLAVGSMLLVAPRRFGKTSVMLYLRNHPPEGFHAIFVDVEGFDHPSQFITEVMTELSRRLPRIQRALRSFAGLPDQLRNLLRETFSDIEVADFKVGLRQLLQKGWRDTGHDLLQLVRQVGDPIVLLVDELPLMLKRMLDGAAKDEVEPFLYWLRALRLDPDALQNTRFVLGGSIGIEHVLERAGAVGAINDLERITIGPFAIDTARQFVRELFVSQGQEVSREIVERVLTEVEVGIPYFLQVLVSEVMKTARDRSFPITPALVASTYRQHVLGVECRSYFQHYHDRLRLYYSADETRAAMALLAAVARAGTMTEQALVNVSKAVLGTEATAEGFSYLTGDMENDFYLHRTESGHRFHTKVLRDWWLRFYGMEF